MRQIFYIDIDEEITSVIERLRKADSGEIFFVVPKNALVLQSIVSLKLLKREANKIKKRVAIVSQDQEGKIKSEKAGIFTLSSLDGLEGFQDAGQKNGVEKRTQAVNESEKLSKNKRIRFLGSSDFYEENERNGKIKTAGAPIEMKINPPQATSSFQSQSQLSPPDVEHKFSRDKSFSEFFDNYQGVRSSLPPDRQSVSGEQSSVSHVLKKILIAAVALLFLAGAGIAAYLFLPKATLFVALKRDLFKEVDGKIKADVKNTEVDYQNKTIPARLIEKEGLITLSHKGTGNKTISSQKAKGVIIIYNEFSSASQSLVATTRFKDTEGKIFRLTRGVVVPGVTEISGKKQPGVIEAEVVADEAGSQYNINPTTFTIPGFEGGSKFEKIYARSTKPMAGGGSGTAGQEGLVVSKEDISVAKSKTEAELLKKLSEEIKKEAGEEDYIVFQAKETTILESSTSARPDENVSEFSYSAKGMLKVLAFSEKDAKNILENDFRRSSDGSQNNMTFAQIEYRDITFIDGIQAADLTFHARIFMKPKINEEEFHENVLGKNMDQLREIQRIYPQVEKIDIDFWPAFLSEKIPDYKSRVKIQID